MHEFLVLLIFRDRVVTLAICVYCSLSFIVIGYDELFSLWAATGPEHGKVFVFLTEK